MGDPVDDRRDLGDAQAIIRLQDAQSGLGHSGRPGFDRVLHNGEAAAALDGNETRRAIAAVAREQNAENSRPKALGGRSEQNIHRGTMHVFFRPAYQPDAPVLNQHVEVGRGDVNAPVLRYLIIAGMFGGERPGLAEQMRKKALGARPHMQDDQNDSLKVMWKSADQFLESFDSPGRRADHNDVPANAFYLIHFAALFVAAGGVWMRTPERYRRHFTNGSGI
jgi:hypothetical protein